MSLERLRKLSGLIAIRKTDNAIFEPSFPDEYGEGQAIADILLMRRLFYFRRVVPVRLLWMVRWVRTGEIWEPQSGEFKLETIVWAESVLKELP